jgi:BlaI family penicillinase repressor
MRLPDAYLSRREQQLVEILYREGPLTANEILPLVPDSPGNSTIRKLLGRLEERGAVKHEEVNGRFVYSPIHPKSDAGKNVLAEAVETFFAGSVTQTVAALLTGGGKLSSDEIADIERLIELAKQEGR